MHESDRTQFLHHFTNLGIVTIETLKKELTSLFGGWSTSAAISTRSLKGGPCGLLGLYNSLYTNFLDNYDSTSRDFNTKRELLMVIAEKLTQRIKDEAHLVRQRTTSNPGAISNDTIYTACEPSKMYSATSHPFSTVSASCALTPPHTNPSIE